MANTTNSKSTTTPKTTTKKEVASAAPSAPVVDTEKEQLKAQLAEQQKRMEEMMAQMQVLMQAQSNVETPVKTMAERKSRSIKFINLVPGALNLKGTRAHRIEGQFASRMIPESEARVIVNNMPETVSSGMVYIADAEFVKEMELSDAYDNILSDKQLKDILHKNANDVCDIYQNAPEAQKAIIISMIANKCMDGIPVDANILMRLGEISGVDFLDIEPLDDKE